MRNFIVGDIIKGKENNGYGYTEERMTKAEVLSVYGDRMKIKVLEHKDASYIGNITNVDNTYTKFELVRGKKVTKKELLAMPIGTKITTNARTKVWGYNPYIYTGEKFVSIGGNCLLKDTINEDLTLETDTGAFDSTEFDGSKIIKIEEPEYVTIYEEKLEMTIAEIEKELGHPVKIVKEED